MPGVRSRLLLIGGCFVLLSGCGGGGSTTGSGGGGGGINPTVVTLSFQATPALVATKIGSGTFAAQAISGNTNTLSLSIPSGTSTYAVAYLCPVQTIGQTVYTEEEVWEASVADGNSISLICSYVSGTGPTMGTLTGSLDASAIPGVTSFTLAAQNGAAVIESGGQGSGSTANINTYAPTGSDRVLVLADGPQGALAAKNFTNQVVPGALNGGNTVMFGAADQTATAAITYNNVPSGFSAPSTYVALNMGGAQVGLGVNSAATTQYSVLPAEALESGDFYSLAAGTSATGNSSSGVSALTTSSGGPVSITFPAPWTYAGPAPAAQPAFTFNYTGTSGTTNAYQSAMYTWPAGTSGSTTDAVDLTATLNYQAGSTTLTVPDLSTVSGFLSAPASGAQVTWYAQIWQSSYGFNWPPSTSNSTYMGAWNRGSFTVP